MNNILSLLRVHQWVKNGFIIFPLVFSGLFRDWDKCIAVAIVIGAFCFIASSVYIFNDLLDSKRDLQHPKKKLRPLSAGSIKPVTAALIAVLLLLIGAYSCFMVNVGVGVLVIIYVALHLVYNFWAKNVVILDVFFIAFGFLIRVWIGSWVIGVSPSMWLLMCVFVLSLFLGFNKRRAEITLLKDSAVAHRQALLEYNTYLLDQLAVITSTLTVVFYGLYTISPEIVARLGGHQLTYSLAFVIFGIFRYLYLVHVKQQGDEPGELLLSDAPMLINALLWLVYVGLVFYR